MHDSSFLLPPLQTYTYKKKRHLVPDLNMFIIDPFLEVLLCLVVPPYLAVLQTQLLATYSDRAAAYSVGTQSSVGSLRGEGKAGQQQASPRRRRDQQGREEEMVDRQQESLRHLERRACWVV